MEAEREAVLDAAVEAGAGERASWSSTRSTSTTEIAWIPALEIEL